MSAPSAAFEEVAGGAVARLIGRVASMPWIGQLEVHEPIEPTLRHLPRALASPVSAPRRLEESMCHAPGAPGLVVDSTPSIPNVASTPIRENDLGYLRACRHQVMRCVEGLDQYQLRHPMTPTGTNLIGVVKHLIGIEAGYLGACLGRPFARSLPWIDDSEAGPNQDMWATAEETSEHIVQLYQEACDHSDTVLAEVGLEAFASVTWWPEGMRATTAGALLSRVLKDTAMHAGQLQILRELIDGRGGDDRTDTGDDQWWTDYTQELERLARQFRS